MRGHVINETEIKHVLDHTLRFKGGVAGERALPALTAALMGAVHCGFYHESVTWPEILLYPDAEVPKVVKDCTQDKLRKAISEAIRFTWVADAMPHCRMMLHNIYATRPQPREMLYGLCQKVLAEAGFVNECDYDAFIRHQVAGWFTMPDIRSSDDLDALVTLIDYFQANCTEVHPCALSEYIRLQRPGGSTKLRNAIGRLLFKVNWALILRDTSLSGDPDIGSIIGSMWDSLTA